MVFKQFLKTLLFVIFIPFGIMDARIETCFTPSPQQQCLNMILKNIANAQKTIYLQGYSFTQPMISEALKHAHKRGVVVCVLLDKGQKLAPNSQCHTLQESGIPVAFDKVHGLAHNKIIIIDETCVITGSYNWTKAAEKRNAENLVVIQDEDAVRNYCDNWNKRWNRRQDYCNNNENLKEKRMKPLKFLRRKIG